MIHDVETYITIRYTMCDLISYLIDSMADGVSASMYDMGHRAYYMIRYNCNGVYDMKCDTAATYTI